ncbi:MAG: iron-siderophore ABC transporter substrate-binding protein [Rubrobacteraceae bacterium]
MTKTTGRRILLPPEIKSDLTRREFLIGAGLIALAPGCGSDGESGEGASANARIIEHKYGSTEVSGRPERIVTVGLSDQDAVLALGVKPVGVTDWYGDYPDATWPWARDEFGDELPEVVGDATGYNFEAVAARNPDLILGLFSGLTGQQYETLSEIAPTIARPSEYADFGVPWQEATRITGRTLGRSERAEEVISGIEARFAEAREEHPEFDGATAVMAAFNSPGDYTVYGPEDPRSRFLDSLGFEYPDAIAELVGAGSAATISAERFDLLDQDVLVWLTSTPPGLIPELEESEIYQRLDVVREGRDVFLEEDDKVLDGALSFSTVLSLPYALDNLVPMLASAIDGDPDTTVESNS